MNKVMNTWWNFGLQNWTQMFDNFIISNGLLMSLVLLCFFFKVKLCARMNVLGIGDSRSPVEHWPSCVRVPTFGKWFIYLLVIASNSVEPFFVAWNFGHFSWNFPVQSRSHSLIFSETGDQTNPSSIGSVRPPRSRRSKIVERFGWNGRIKHICGCPRSCVPLVSELPALVSSFRYFHIAQILPSWFATAMWGPGSKFLFGGLESMDRCAGVKMKALLTNSCIAKNMLQQHINVKKMDAFFHGLHFAKHRTSWHECKRG